MPKIKTASLPTPKPPIYSISHHPSLPILASASLDYSIKLYSTANFDLIHTLALHDGAVLVIKFDKSGLMASGSDDKKVVVWSPIADQSEFPNYKASKVLYGHESDVSGLSWSEKFLASAGFDSKIIIWSRSTFEKVKVLDGHVAFVKGVAFDPTGAFLASQSDDKTVKIWRSGDWSLEFSLSEPFDGKSTTFFRRLDWAPDGGLLGMVNGDQRGVNVGVVVEREKWDLTTFLVGHEDPIEVICFNPHIFVKDGVESCIVAMGSQDSGVSVWLTSNSRAILVIKELFSHSVLDLAWSSDGLKLYACSYDGSIAEVEFEEREFGTRIAVGEVNERVERAGRVRVVPPESFEILQLEKSLAKEDPMDRLFDNHENMGLNGKTALAPTTTVTSNQSAFTRVSSTPSTPRKSFNISQQAVSIDKDGKKRIKPVLVQASLPISSPSKQFGDRENISPQDREGKRLRQEDIGVTSYTLPTVLQASKENLFKVPPVRKVFSTQVERFGNLDVAEFKNNANGCVMTCARDDNLIWKSSYNQPALIAVMTNKFTAIGFADSYIIIHTLSGKRLLPMKMKTPPSYLHASGDNLLHCDAFGNIQVWDIPKMNCLFKDISLSPLLDLKIITLELKIVESGLIIQAKSTKGQIYIYNHDLCVWNCTSFNTGLIPSIEDVETQLATAIFTNDSKNVIYWLKIYARRLTESSNLLKVEELVDEFNCEGAIGGMDRIDMYKQVLPILVQNRSFQRILVK